MLPDLAPITGRIYVLGSDFYFETDLVSSIDKKLIPQAIVPRSSVNYFYS